MWFLFLVMYTLIFASEKEDNYNSIPFIDTKFIRMDNRLMKDWYGNPISSGRYINYWAYHTHSIKINLIKQMNNRALSISVSSFHQKKS